MQDDGYGQPLIKDNNGTQVYPQVIDRYGNYWTSDASGNLIDDLGRTPVIVTQSGNTTYYDVLAANGTINNNGLRVRYAVTTAPVSVSTGFGGPQDWVGTLYPVQSIQLPDGSSYSFSYDGYGELSGVTLPTGGVITYGYANFVDALSNKNRWVYSRTVGGNPATTFTYSSYGCSGGSCTQSLILHKPSGDETDYEFMLINGAWNSSIFAFSGSTMSGNQLMSVSNSYDFSNTCSGSGACTGPEYIHRTNTYTTLPQVGLQSQTQQEYDFPALGKPSASRVWDYYPELGSPSTIPARETDYAYTASGYDIQQVTVKGSSGNTASQTTYGYTTSATTMLGVTGHGSGNAGGPYLHTVTKLLDGVNDPVTTYTMDDTGMVRGISDPKGNPTSFTYQCSNTYPDQVSNALSQPTAYGYDCNSGQITSVKDANDIAASRAGTTYTYDSAGRLYLLQTADGGQTTYTYPSAMEVDTAVLETTVPTAVSINSSDILDIYGRPYQHTQAGVSTEITYDSSGRKYCVTNPHATGSSTDSTCVTTYDGLDRPKLVTQPDSTTLSWTYNGNVTTSADETGNSWVRTSNALGQLTKVIEPGGLQTGYTYDGLGNLTCVEQHGGVSGTGCSSDPSSDASSPWRIRRFIYDGVSQLTSSTNPESGTIRYSYDNNGNLIQKVSPAVNQASGTTTLGYCFDSLNRLTSKFYSSPNCQNPSSAALVASYSYDTSTIAGAQNIIGRLTSENAISNGVIYSQRMPYVYDAMGRIKNERQCVLASCASPNELQYSYDLSGNLTYSNNGLLNSQSPQIGWTNKYDASGRLSKVVSNWDDLLHPAILFKADQSLVISNTSYDPYSPFGLAAAQYGVNETANTTALAELRSYDNRGRLITKSVLGGSTSSTSATSSVTPATFGLLSTATLHANISCNSACGQVDVHVDAIDLGLQSVDSSGNVTISTSAFPASARSIGTHAVTVLYIGNGSYASSSSSTSYTVTTQPTNIDFTITPSSFTTVDSPQVSIHVSCNSACGQVSLSLDGNGWIPPYDVDGNGNIPGYYSISAWPNPNLTPGTTHTVTAHYLGNATFAPSTKDYTITVVPIGSQQTSVNLMVNPPTFTSVEDAIASVHVGCNSACGVVQFTIDNNGWVAWNLDSNGNTSADTYWWPNSNFTQGTHTLTAHYLGNSVYAPNSDFKTITVSPVGTQSLAITLSPLSGSTFSISDYSWFGIHADCSSNCNGFMQIIVDGNPWISFELDQNGNGSVSKWSGDTGYFSPGIHNVKAHFQGNATYAPSDSNNLTVTVTQ